MTVKDLIEELKKYPEDMNIVRYYEEDGDWEFIDTVKIVKMVGDATFCYEDYDNSYPNSVEMLYIT